MSIGYVLANITVLMNTKETFCLEILWGKIFVATFKKIAMFYNAE